MRDRRIVLLLILIMTAVSLSVAGIAIQRLYNTALAEQRARLVETVQSQARLVESIIRWERVEAERRADGIGHGLEHVMSVLVDAHKHYVGFGETGEFTLARRQDQDIVFLLSHRHADLDNPKPVPFASFDSQLAEPMRRALSGLSGTVVGIDYRGVEVLAAHEPVAEVNWGIVAKIDLAEVRAPFFRAGLVTVCAGLVVVLVGALLFVRVSNPLLSRLEESEAQNRAIVETAADGIITVNGQGTIETFNPASERIFSCSADEAIGTNIKSFLQGPPQPGGDDFLTTYLESAGDQDGSLSRETTGQRWDGTPFPMELTISALRGVQTRMFTVIARDATDRKMSEEKVLAAQKQLFEQQRRETERVEAELDKVRNELIRKTRLAAIGQVSASIGHELRNPLGAIRNSIYLLRRRCPKSAQQWTEYLDIVDQEVHRANGTISNLMEMSRPKEPNRQEVDLGRIVQQAWAQLALPTGIKLQEAYEPDPFTIMADQEQLRHVLGNLISNAVQAMEGQPGRITVGASRTEGYDTVSVEDDGEGVPAEHRERLFEPLFSTKAKGTGLGLTICRQVIEAHAGTIDLVPAQGHGAAFQIRVPRAVRTETG